MELLRGSQRAQGAIEVAALRERLSQGLVAGRLLGAVREALRRMEPFLGGASGVTVLTVLGEEEGEVGKLGRCAW